MAFQVSRSLGCPRWLPFLPLFVPAVATAQLFTDPDVPPVIRFRSERLVHPFTGGTESPIIQLVDLNGDGALDLALADKDRTLRIFQAIPGSTLPPWTAEPVLVRDISVPGWFRFADLDGDGDKDLFVGGPSASVLMHEHLGSPTRMIIDPRPTPLMDENGAAVTNESVNIPAFADPDGDGDLDFFAGNSAGSIVYYENNGSATSPAFRYVTDVYQGLTIIGFGRAAGDPQAIRSLHGAMGIDFGDLDGDGDLDILWGDFFNPSIYFLLNNGSPGRPHYVLADSSFPDAHPVLSSGFNLPALGDVDADGDIDLVVGVVSGFRSTHNLFLFANEAPGSLTFRLVSSDPLGSLDLGVVSRPAVGDVTGDGVPDVVIGEGGGSVRILRGLPSTGIASEFELEPDSLIFLPNVYLLDPAVGDLDGDGINEILIGDFTGRLRLFHYTSTWEEDTMFSLRGTVFGSSIAPELTDADQDGDLDMIAGFANGTLKYYENRGTASAPVFTEVAGRFAGIRVGGEAVPLAADVDDDGRSDLLLGSQSEGVSLLLATETGYVPYPYLFSGRQVSLNTAPAIIRHGGIAYMLSGNLKGGLDVFQRSSWRIARLGGVTMDVPFPNPASETVTIRFVLGASEEARPRILDLLGREVRSGSEDYRGPGYFSETFKVDDLASGVYLVRLPGSMQAARRFVVVR